MKITDSTLQGRVPVAALHLEGDLDASNYAAAIQKARELYDGGARDLVIDLGGVTFMSSAGLMAIHSIALMFRGDEATPSGAAFRSIDPERDRAVRQHVKLVNPQKQVKEVLDVVGLLQFFPVFDNLDDAVKSF